MRVEALLLGRQLSLVGLRRALRGAIVAARLDRLALLKNGLVARETTHDFVVRGRDRV